MKKLMISMALMSLSTFANEQLCGIDYASMNFVQKESVISTDSKYLVKAMDKVEKICETKELTVEKSLMFVHGYFDGYDDSPYNSTGPDSDLTLSVSSEQSNNDDVWTEGYEETSNDLKALIQICSDSLSNIKSIQSSCGVEIALEVEAALYNLQSFCQIAENQNGYLAGYLDGME